MDRAWYFPIGRVNTHVIFIIIKQGSPEAGLVKYGERITGNSDLKEFLFSWVLTGCSLNEESLLPAGGWDRALPPEGGTGGPGHG